MAVEEVDVEEVGGGDVGDSEMDKQGDAGGTQAIQKQTSDCSSTLTNRLPKRE